MAKDTMLAAVLEGVGQMPLREVPKPHPGPGEVVVRIAACGICQTDYCAYTGARTNFTPPIIVGHEMAGVVAEVGEGVTNVKEGDEVVISPAGFCGLCRWCRSGLQHYCPNGFVIGGEGFANVWNGGFAEYTKAPASVLYHKPKEISFTAAALTEPLAGSYKGLIEYTQMRVGEDVVIIGAGSMGLLLTSIAAAAGAGTLIVADINDFRLDMAKKLGAHHVINLKRENGRDAVYSILPEGPDIVFEAAGALEAASLAMQLCRRGTRVNMFGVIVPGTIPVSPADVHFLETRVDASFSVTPRVMLKSLDLMRKGLVDPSRIVTHEIPLSEMPRALDAMASPNRVKVVVKP
ncbi:MAG: zinc-dependent alcohol dehydrogenase [Armatimonadota bacterium]